MQVKPRLGEQLLAADVIDQERLDKGLALQKLTGGWLLDVLLENRLVEERKLLRFLAETSGARYITADKLSRTPIGQEVLERIPARHAEKLSVLPLAYNERESTLTLALSEIDEGLVEQVRLAAGVREVVPIIASRMAIRAGIKRFYYGDIYAFAQMDESEAPAVLQQEPSAKVLAREPSTIGPCPSASAPAPEGLENLQRELRLLRVANELHHHLARERDVGAILHRVLAFAFDNLPADDGALLVVDPTTKSLIPKGVRTRSGEASEVVISETLVREALETRHGVLTGNALVDERFSHSESVVGAGMRSAMGVPVTVSDEVRAVIFLDTRQRIDVFTEPDLKVLMAIAGQAALALENLELSRQIAGETATRAHLARFFSPGLVEEAASGKLNLSGREAQEATILFADLRGFTSFSEHHGPREVVAMLNDHFAHMVDIVFSNGGILDKFVGDAVMALWGVPLARPDAPAKALRAALEMVERVGDMNALRQIANKEPLQIGIGISSGPVVFGAIGAPRRMELTAIGDAVNIAARLCDMAEPGQIVASLRTVEAAGPAFLTEPLPPAALKGKAQPIEIVSVREEKRSE